jgi:peptidoglycan/LPS O-acetylase OafA/YrhL
LAETAQHIPPPLKTISLKDKAQQKVFFPNLDGLRFICFLMVFLFHTYKTIFQNLRDTNHIAYSVTRFLFSNGELGVNFFFVLSGFLITFLLIKEKEVSGAIHLRNFYIRRILRIWPMFYLCIFIGFVVVPALKTISGQPSSEIARPLYYLLFANNFDYIHSWPAFPDALILIVLWSVAVEEQFYLTWPVFLKFLPKNFYPILFSSVLLFTLIFRSFHLSPTDHNYAVLHFHTFSVIGDMAIGGLMAYFCSYKSGFLNFITNLKKGVIILIYIIAACLILFRDSLFELPVTAVFERVFISVAFGLIILEQNYSKNSFFKFSNLKSISKLGLYTYGLYCLHFFVISIVNGAFSKFGLETSNVVSAITAALISLVGVTFICRLSYQYFEKPFLKLKDRFAFITKGEKS